MLLFVVQALAELAVVYPINGAFYQYVCRFIDPSWLVDGHLDPRARLIMLGALRSVGIMPLDG